MTRLKLTHVSRSELSGLLLQLLMVGMLWLGAISDLIAGSYLSKTITKEPALIEEVPLDQRLGCIERQARIPLSLSFAPQAASHYVSGAIPFALGRLLRLDQLSVVDEACQSLPFEAFTLSVWPDRSLKSVLIFLSSAIEGQAQGGAFLRIANSVTEGEPTADADADTDEEKATLDKPLDKPSPIEFFYQQDGDYLSVKTDRLLTRIPTQKFALFNEVRHLANATPENPRGHVLITGGDIYLENSHNQRKYFAALGKPTISVAREGSLTLEVTATGQLHNLWKEQLLEYELRYRFYMGVDYIDLDFTVTDTRPEENVYARRDILPLAVTDYGLRFQHSVQSGQYEFGKTWGMMDQTFSGTLSTPVHLVQVGQMHYKDGAPAADNGALYDFAYRIEQDQGEQRRVLKQGKRAQGWAGVYHETASVAVMVKDFWQQFPNRLTLSKDQIEVSLHPRESVGEQSDTRHPKLVKGQGYQRPNTFYAPREGMAKTYQLRLLLQPGGASAPLAQGFLAHFNSHELQLRAPLSWYAASKVFGDITLSNADSQHYDDFLYHRILRRSLEQGPFVRLYGWRDYGDRMRPRPTFERNEVKIPTFYNDTHVGSNPFFVHYLRTGRQAWFEMAALATRHFMDIDVSHAPRKGHWSIDGRKAYAPPGEIHAIKHQMEDHHSRNVHYGHAHLSGLSNYYLLTGDPRSLAVIQRIGNWWGTMIPQRFPLPKKPNHYTGSERDFGWPLYVINEVVRVTNDTDLHQQAAAHLVKFLLQWWQTPGDHIINGEKISENDASQGTGWWRMTRMNNGSGTGTNPWMAGALLTNLIRFLQADAHIGSDIDPVQVKQMLYHTTQDVQ